MTAPFTDIRISTVAPRPGPAPKGRGRPVGTPLTVLEGPADTRGASSAGLPPARTWLVVVELEDTDGVIGVGTAGFGNPAAIDNAHLAVTSLATPLLEYMPPPTPDEADEDQVFWMAFPDEPRAENGRVTLSDGPGLDVGVDRTVLERIPG